MHRFTAVIKRHHDDLPAYLIVPGELGDDYGKQGTFVVELVINGKEIGRRSIKPWGDGRWFLELTRKQCGQLDIQPGDVVSVDALPAVETPPELMSLIDQHNLGVRWRGLSDAQRRAFSEHIFDAKKESTRKSRLERTISWLRRHG